MPLAFVVAYRVREKLSAPHLWLFVLVAAVLVYLVVPPALFVLRTSLVSEFGPDAGSFTFQHYRTIFGSLSDFGQLIWNSFLFSTGSAFVALCLGTAIAWLAERSDAPFRNLAYAFAYVSFGVSSIVKVIGWVLLFGPRAGMVNVAIRDFTGIAVFFNIFSLAGMILVEALVLTPLVFLLMAPAFRSMDPALEEAALVAGSSGWQVFRRVTFPVALPSALSVLLLTFIRAIESFETPALIGLPAGIEVLTTKIYLEIQGGFVPRYGEASAYAVVLMSVVVVGLTLYHRATAEGYKFATVTGKGYRPRKIELGRWRRLGGVVLLAFASFQVLPLCALAWVSFLPYTLQPSRAALDQVSFDNYSKTLADPVLLLAVKNTFMASGLAAFTAVLITFVAAWLIIRTNFSGRWILDQLATFPLVMPGLVIAVALLNLYAAVPLPIYGTIWIIFLAFVTNFLPYGMRFSYAGLLTIHRELEESSSTCGAAWRQTVTRILVPLMVPALATGCIYIFLVTVRSLTIPLLLYGPGTQLISVMLWELWDHGRIGEVAAFSLLTTSATVFLALWFRRLSERTVVAV